MSQSNPLTTKQQYWLDHLIACERSGQSMKDYAEQHGLITSAFYAWKKTLRRKGVPRTSFSVASTIFQKVALRHPSTLRLVLPTGLTLEIDTGTDPQWLAQLVRALS